MKQLILRSFQSPGDIVMLTAAVRDLHRTYPGKFLTDVRTPCPQLWENNPYLTPLAEEDVDVELVDCQYPLIHKSNEAPYHFIHGFIAHLNEQFGLSIAPTAFRGDIHISPLEKSWYSQVEEILGHAVPYWIVVAGGKFDYTTKWWDQKRYQQVIDHFRDRILFVQVGQAGHSHPPLHNVVDLRGKTDLRQLVRLVYHAQGVLCPVTLVMHLAAAVETQPGMPKNRPCVVVAGGREPPQWEAYPHHQFLHRAGALRCCDNGGCWKSRVVPLGDGDEKDAPENLCVDVVGALPRCMDLITAADVIRAIEIYFEGGAISYLTPEKRWKAMAASIQGWMDHAELEWLALHASRRRTIIELGSWKGRSTKALAAATLGVVWAVDHWNGSDDPADDTFKEIQREGSEAVFTEFAGNLSEEISSGKVVPIRASGIDAARWLSELLPGGSADMIFIDGEHGYEAVRRDLYAFRPLLARGGMICGHDYDTYWPGVVRAVDEVFSNRRKGPGSIWYVESGGPET